MRNYLELIRRDAAGKANELSKKAKEDLILPELNIYNPASSRNPRDGDGKTREQLVQDAIDEAERLGGN